MLRHKLLECETLFAIVFSSITISIATITAKISSIFVLNGTNFNTWKEINSFVLGCISLDTVLWKVQLLALTYESSFEAKRDYQCSNHMNLIMMKHNILEAFKEANVRWENAKKFLEQIYKCFTKNKNVETWTFLANVISLKYKGKGNMSYRKFKRVHYENV